MLALPWGSCLERIIKSLNQNNIENIVLNTHYLSHKIEDFVKDSKNIKTLFEKEILETGGGVLNAASFFDNDILVINGDIWFENLTILLEDFLEAYKKSNFQNLLLLIDKKSALFYEGMGDYFIKRQTSGKNSINSIIHKSSIHENKAPYIFGGLQIWKKDFLICNKPEKDFFSMRYYFDLAEKQNNLNGYVSTIKWCDIGTLNAYNGLFKYLK